MVYDTIIVGGGPAGLSAALVLGRCLRRVLLVDSGRPRNYASRAVHNFITSDGVPPMELRRLGRREIARCGVEVIDGTAVGARCLDPGFSVSIKGFGTRQARTLLLATGVVDELPDIPGLREHYGIGVHHCPYCDGWEHRGRPLAAFGHGRKGVGLAMSLQTWSPSVTVVTHGRRLAAAPRDQAERLGIKVREEPIAGFVRAGGARKATRARGLERIEFTRGEPLRVGALFFNTEQWQRSRLPLSLGCRMDEKGGVLHDRRQRTGVTGLYLAGDASKDVQFAVVAAAEGAKAGVAINAELQVLDRGSKKARPSARSVAARM